MLETSSIFFKKIKLISFTLKHIHFVFDIVNAADELFECVWAFWGLALKGLIFGK